MKRVLYLHGLDSQPTSEKTHLLSKLGCSIIAPQMHYREERNLYTRVLNLAQYFEIDWLIGSSLGGYTAFWLSHQLHKPALLINPALNFRAYDPGLVPKNIAFTYPKQFIYRGMQDNVVLPKDTENWLSANHLSDKVHFIDDEYNGHRIEAQKLTRVFSNALDNIVEFKFLNSEFSAITV